MPQMRGLPLAHAAFQASRRCNGTVYVDNITRLGSATGSLAKQGQIWHTGLAVYDLRSKALQSALCDANAVVQLVHKGDQVRLRFPCRHLK